MTDEQALEAIDAWIAELEVGARTDEMSRAFKVARDILLYDRNAQHKKAVLSRALVAQEARARKLVEALERICREPDSTECCGNLQPGNHPEDEPQCCGSPEGNHYQIARAALAEWRNP